MWQGQQKKGSESWFFFCNGTKLHGTLEPLGYWNFSPATIHLCSSLCHCSAHTCHFNQRRRETKSSTHFPCSCVCKTKSHSNLQWLLQLLLSFVASFSASIIPALVARKNVSSAFKCLSRNGWQLAAAYAELLWVPATWLPNSTNQDDEFSAVRSDATVWRTNETAEHCKKWLEAKRWCAHYLDSRSNSSLDQTNLDGIRWDIKQSNEPKSRKQNKLSTTWEILIRYTLQVCMVTIGTNNRLGIVICHFIIESACIQSFGWRIHPIIQIAFAYCN